MAATESEQSLATIVATLGAAWDRADGKAFAAVFSENADFVNILGEAFSGRQAIAAQHQAIFDTIYRGSHAVFEVSKLRQLRDDAAVAQVTATLDAPSGPRPGVTNTLATVVLISADGRWEIAAFHNTVVIPAPR